MRFLMLNWRDPGNPLSGGAEKVTLGYLSGLVKRGHEVFWFANSFSGSQPKDEFEGVQIIRGGNIGTSFFHAWIWARRQVPFDLIIDQHHGIPWFSPWWGRTKSIAYLHEVLGPIWQSFYPKHLAKLGCFFERQCIKLYSNIPFWTASSSTKSILKTLGIKSVKIIPYGVSSIAINAFPRKRIQPPLRLIVVSRLAPNKRIDHAIDAVKLLIKRGRKAHLSIVGEGEMQGILQKKAASLGLEKVVHFEGLLSESEKDRRLERSHLLLHTSVREGWGLNVIEANCAGTPAVVYPVEGLIESTLHEKTGLIVEEESPDSLANGIERMIEKPALYEKCRVAAIQKGAEFHWDLILPKACDWLEAQAQNNC